MNKVQEWKEISRQVGPRSFGKGIDKVIFCLPNGKEVEFSIFSGGQSVACLALTKNNEVLLVKQFRPGPKQILLELPGGGLKEGESAETAIARELLEETGYKGGNIQFVTSLLENAYTPFIKNAWVATDCEKVAEPQLEDNGEEIETVLMSLDEFRTHIRSGQMTDVEISYLCLDYLNLL